MKITVEAEDIAKAMALLVEMTIVDIGFTPGYNSERLLKAKENLYKDIVDVDCIGRSALEFDNILNAIKREEKAFLQ